MYKIEYDVPCPQKNYSKPCKHKEVYDELWWFLHSSKKVLTLTVDNPGVITTFLYGCPNRMGNIRWGYRGNELTVIKK